MTKKHRIRIGIIVAIICVMSFSDRSFAQETKNEDIEFLGMALNVVIGRMSWLRIIFAKLAGELLTNRWVYGEIMGLDVLLWKYWNVVKNFANLGLGLYFMYIIFRGLISAGKNSIEKTLKDSLLWLLIAGVGIQASWFLTAALIDLSTVTLSAASSFPSVVISQSPYIEGEVRSSIKEAFSMQESQVTQVKVIRVGEGVKKGKFVEFLHNDAPQLTELNKPESMTGLLDMLQPRPSDVSGPLYLIGFSILNIKDITSINSTNLNGWKATVFNSIIQGGATLIYGIEMLVLCIAAVMRILYLWLFIIVSPIAILLRCIQKSGEKIGGSNKGFLSEFMTQLNFGTVLINVFKPTIVVLGLGVAALFAGLMANIVASTSEKTFVYKGISYSQKEDNTKVTEGEGDIKYVSNMDHNLIGLSLANVGKTLLELVLSILTVILVYQIIKVAMTMGNGKDFVGKRIDSIQSNVGKLMGTIPVVPVPGFDKQGAPTTHYIGASKVFGFGDNRGRSLLDDMISKKTDKIDEYNRKDEAQIRKWFGDDTEDLSAEEVGDIRNAMTDKSTPGDNLKEARSIIQKRIRNKNGRGMTLNDGVWKTEFEKWLTLMEGKEENLTDSGLTDLELTTWKNMIRAWKDLGQGKTLEKLFGDSKNGQKFRKAYASFFLDKDDTRIDSETDSRNKFVLIDISKTPEKDSSSNGTSASTTGNGEGGATGDTTTSASGNEAAGSGAEDATGS